MTTLKSTLLIVGIVFYFCAVAFTNLTRSSKRLYWPLYLPPAVIAAVVIAKAKR